jgi:hypothetical protein
MANFLLKNQKVKKHKKYLHQDAGLNLSLFSNCFVLKKNCDKLLRSGQPTQVRHAAEQNI